MSVGFAATTQTSNDVISNFFKQKPFDINDVSAQRDFWYQEYKTRQHNPTVESLLDPEYQDFSITMNPKYENVRQSHQHQIPHLYGKNGLWSLSLSDHGTHLDFTISTWVGDCMRFHPDVIEEDLVGRYGSTVYNSWKSFVLDDIESLEELVSAARKKVNRVYHSITCCDRSSRLCERVGIPVRNGHAFFLPSKIKI